MGQLFEPCEPEQGLLFPPSLDDWLPEGHLARFIGDTVDQLDLKPLSAKYEERDDGRGRICLAERNVGISKGLSAWSSLLGGARGGGMMPVEVAEGTYWFRSG